MMKPLIGQVLVALFLACSAQANENELTERAKRYQEGKLQPDEGVAMALLEGDETTFAAAGRLGKDRDLVDENTLFEIGSITKVFTGILLADQVQRGKASLDDPIAKHLPDSVLPKDSPLASVTLLDLATHTSGLPRLPGNLESEDLDPGDPYANYSVDDLHEYLKNFQETDFEERGKQSYSNLGVGLLGHILERISGMPYEALLTKTILAPLEMDSTFVQRAKGDLPKKSAGRFATGHSEGRETSHWHIDALCGAGAIVSSAADMAKFATAHWNESTPTELRAAMDLAMRETRNDMGLAWFHGDKGYWHNGGTGGFRSELKISPENRTAEIMLTNGAEPPQSTKVEGDFKKISGFWSGTLNANGVELRQFLRISESGQVVLHSLDQALQGIPSTSATFDGSTLTAEFPGIRAKFTGKFADDLLAGEFEQGVTLPLSLKRAEQLPPKLSEFLKQRIDGDISTINGFWSGMIGGKGGLFVILQIESVADAGEAWLYSPTQMPGALSVDQLKIEGRQLELKIETVHGSYEAEIDGKTMEGTWSQGAPMPLKLKWSKSRPEQK
ncbi:MAG: beta-lactamase family protein [Verrucomicrobiae bacterium]|nr:beta-lactamase family protein [Verrucomicrobiae bacterium]